MVWLLLPEVSVLVSGVQLPCRSDYFSLILTYPSDIDNKYFALYKCNGITMPAVRRPAQKRQGRGHRFRQTRCEPPRPGASARHEDAVTGH